MTIWVNEWGEKVARKGENKREGQREERKRRGLREEGE